MKRLASIALLCFATINVLNAQTAGGSHLQFKGVAIDGKLDDFVSRMQEAGFTLTGTKDGFAILEGDFASYKNCTIGVSTLKGQDLVSNIAVIFPNKDNWSQLSYNYFNIKALLTEKYGKPSRSVELFESKSLTDDGSKMLQVKVDQYKYYSVFEINNGTIQLSIEHDSDRNCFVKLAYADKINSETVKKGALNDL